MFEQVEEYPVDPIMIGAEYFAQDPRFDKLNLTVGIYQDEIGQTPVIKAVKLAEQRLVDTQTSKSYLALTGDAEYCRVLGQEILGPDLYDDSFVAAQTSGGAVALRVMADLLAQMPTRPTIWLQTPTYGNYVPILTAAGALFKSVPYYDPIRREIVFDQMLEGLNAAQPGDVFLMQGVCHNPTGADMTPDQFEALLDLLEDRGIVPWIDLAYLGFARSWDADCTMARKIAVRFPECIVCVTLSKSFGIYRDRAGALFVKTRAGDRDRIPNRPEPQRHHHAQRRQSRQHQQCRLQPEPRHQPAGQRIGHQPTGMRQGKLRGKDGRAILRMCRTAQQPPRRCQHRRIAQPHNGPCDQQHGPAQPVECSHGGKQQ